jgi:iron(III) transport system substrate-binding protein
MVLPRALAVLLALALASLPACSRRDPAPPSSTEATESASASQPSTERVLRIYCGRNEEMLRPLVERYQRETGVEVITQYAGSSTLAATLLEEGDRARADLFFAQDVSTLGFLEREGRLAALPDDILQRVPASFRSTEGRWVGTTGRARALVYNTEFFAERALPHSIDALLDESLRGRVGWSPENASFQSFLAALIVERGEAGARQWLTAMQAQEPRAYPSNTPMVVAASRGEIVAGLTNHYYLYRVQQENNGTLPIENHYFRNQRAEALINAAGVGVIAGSPNADAAHAFVRWLLSNEVQGWFGESTHEFPLVTGVERPGTLPMYNELAPPAIDLGALGDLESAVRLLNETGILR